MNLSENDIEGNIDDIMGTMIHKGCDHLTIEQGDLILFALRFLKSNLDQDTIDSINQ